MKETIGDFLLHYDAKSFGNADTAMDLEGFRLALDSLEKAVNSHGKDDFVRTYTSLTTQCNSCHQIAGLDFYAIIAPKTPAYNTDIE